MEHVQTSDDSEVLQDGFEYITRDGPRRCQILGVLIVIFMVFTIEL